MKTLVERFKELNVLLEDTETVYQISNRKDNSIVFTGTYKECVAENTEIMRRSNISLYELHTKYEFEKQK